jgi:hypothetical protein
MQKILWLSQRSFYQKDKAQRKKPGQSPVSSVMGEAFGIFKSTDARRTRCLKRRNLKDPPARGD